MPVDEHRARTADTQSATEPGALQAEVVAQHVQQCGVIVGMNLPRVAVHMNLCHESSITAPADNRQQGTSHRPRRTSGQLLGNSQDAHHHGQNTQCLAGPVPTHCELPGDVDEVAWRATPVTYPNWPLGPELGEEG